jgi:hypothetical protein
MRASEYIYAGDSTVELDMRLPAIKADVLMEDAMLHDPNPAYTLAWRDFPWWWTYTRAAFNRYCTEHGRHRLPGAVLLLTARQLKYYYDQKARDDRAFIYHNLNEERELGS